MTGDAPAVSIKISALPNAAPVAVADRVHVPLLGQVIRRDPAEIAAARSDAGFASLIYIAAEKVGVPVAVIFICGLIRIRSPLATVSADTDTLSRSAALDELESDVPEAVVRAMSLPFLASAVLSTVPVVGSVMLVVPEVVKVQECAPLRMKISCYLTVFS